MISLVFYAWQCVKQSNIKFNQDIFVTSKCHDKSGPVNYHIELERVRLDLSESTTATLKDIRSIASDAVV